MEIQHDAGPFLTLRSPVGMTAAMLDTVNSSGAPLEADSRRRKPAGDAGAKASLAKVSYTDFAKTRKDLSSRSRRMAEQNKAVDFSRIWWDKMSKKATRRGLSIWRPVAPPGYVPLGDSLWALAKFFSCSWEFSQRRAHIGWTS